MFCSKCGKQLKENTRYCSACGNPVNNTTRYTKKISVQQKNGFENFIGKNVLAIVAAMLIFIGIIAFGVIVLKEMGNIGKLAVLYSGGMIITILGFIFSLKNKSLVNSTVFGCGIGAMYITTLLGGIYYDLIDMIYMNLIILFINAGVLIAIDKLNIKYLTIISSIGSLIAIIFSLTQDLSELDFLGIIAFEALTIALFIFSGYKQKWFKYAIHSSLILNLLLMLLFNSFYSFSFCFECFDIKAVAKIFSFIILLCSSVILIILFSKNSNDRTHFMISASFISATFSFGLKGPLIAFYTHFVRNYAMGEHILSPSHTTDEIANLSCLLSFITISLLFIIFILIYNNAFKARKNSELLIISFIVLHTFMLIDTITLYDFVPLLLLPSLLCLILFMFTNKNIYWAFSFGFLIIETILNPMLLDDANFINTICCSVLLLICSVMLSYAKDKNFISYPVLSFFIISYNFTINLINYLLLNPISTKYDTVILGLAISSIVGILYLSLLYKYPTTKTQQVILGVNKNIFVIFGMLMLMYSCANKHDMLMKTIDYEPCLITGNITEICLALLFLGIAMIRIGEVIKERSNIYGLMYAIKFTLIVLCSLSSLTRIIDNELVASLSYIIVSALCILFGFKTTIKSVRIYGLVMILISVLKLVVVDVWSENSMVRVGALILGGLICFAISAGYTHVEKKIKEQFNNKYPQSTLSVKPDAFNSGAKVSSNNRVVTNKIGNNDERSNQH